MASIGFPDGSGAIGGYDFWTRYCNAAELEIVDVSHDLSELQRISNNLFPANVCLASKYRLGRSVLLAPIADYLVFFLFNDKFVFNCPNSVYRIKWIKSYIEKERLNTKVVVWPFDLNSNGNFEDNLVLLTELLNGNITRIKEFSSFPCNLPLAKKPIYQFGVKTGKKTILMIGKSPFLIDPYRKTLLFDKIIEHFGVLLPHILTAGDTSCMELKGDNVVFYKEESIRKAIDIAISLYELSAVIFVADIFDIPGNYSFPVLMDYCRMKGIPYMHIKPSLHYDAAMAEALVNKIEHLSNS